MIKDKLSARTGVFHPQVTSGDWVTLADTPLITVLAAVEQQKRKEKEEARLAREEVRRQEAEKKEAARQKKRAEQETRRQQEAQIRQRRLAAAERFEAAAMEQPSEVRVYKPGTSAFEDALVRLPGDIAGAMFDGITSECFITTAVCEREDLPDDCQTLTLLRGFRDNYMMATEERVSQVEKYYRIAPSLVELIDQHTDRKRIYGQLRDSFILPAVEAVEAGDNQRAESIYTGMMNWLQVHLA